MDLGLGVLRDLSRAVMARKVIRPRHSPSPRGQIERQGQ
jgi:hypothetical protein